MTAVAVLAVVLAIASVIAWVLRLMAKRDIGSPYTSEQRTWVKERRAANRWRLLPPSYDLWGRALIGFALLAMVAVPALLFLERPAFIGPLSFAMSLTSIAMTLRESLWIRAQPEFQARGRHNPLVRT